MFVAEIIGKKAFQMLLVNRDHMIEQIAPAILDPALGDAILPVTLERRSYGSQAQYDRREPARCKPTNVSGVTRIREPFPWTKAAARLPKRICRRHSILILDADA